MTTAYRADQVGSLLRPAEVLEAHAALTNGRISPGQAREVEDRAILLALELQREVGLAVYSDGEYRRPGWAGDFAAAVDGFVPSEPPIALRWCRLDGTEREPPAAGTAIGERLRQKRRLTAHESLFLKQHAPGPYKMTLPAPSYVVARGFKPGLTTQALPDPRGLDAACRPDSPG